MNAQNLINLKYICGMQFYAKYDIFSGHRKYWKQYILTKVYVH